MDTTSFFSEEKGDSWPNEEDDGEGASQKKEGVWPWLPPYTKQQG